MPLLVRGLGLVAVLCLIPAAHALSLRDHFSARGFFYAGLILSVLVIMLALATGSGRRPGAQSQLAGLVSAYLVLPFAFALPLAAIIPDTSWTNLWFEMLSCFTTTGATVYEPGRLPDSVHLWRAMTGWLGGFYVLLAAWAVLAPLNLGGAEVISGLMPGRGNRGAGTRQADPRDRLSRAASAILPVYAGLTFVLWLGLVIAGERGLVALIHAMGTLSTSGISAVKGLSVAGAGFAGEALIFLFLLLALSRRLMPFALPGHRSGRLREDPEIRLGLTIIATVVVVLLLRHMLSEVVQGVSETPSGLIAAFWGSLFTAASFLTTTGYESHWWLSARDWAGMGAPGLLLMGLAIIGGGVATTAGGVTLLRVVALWQQGRREIEKIIYPGSVGSGAERRRLAQEGARMAWTFFMLFAISVGCVIAALTLAGQDFESALVLGIAALTTTGQLAEIAATAPISYAGLSDPVKLILGLAMVMGRLETLALIALFVPGNWSDAWRR